MQRHLYVHGRRELRPYSTHALTGGSFALRTLALNDQYALAACRGQMPRNAGTYDAAADDDYVCCLHYLVFKASHCLSMACVCARIFSAASVSCDVGAVSALSTVTSS